MELQKYEKEHIDILRRHLGECTVLLKKDGSFPLKETGPIALFGSGVRNTIKGGTGSGEVNSRYSVSVEEAFQKEGFFITTKGWLDRYDEIRAKAKVEFYKNLRKEAKAHHQSTIFYGMGAVMPEPEYEMRMDAVCDTAIYVLARISGEGNDRKPVGGDAQLTDTEIHDIKLANRLFRNFMLVLNVGGAVDLTPVKDVKNILVLSQLGVETGFALTDLVLGRTYPSGRLTTSWAAAEELCSVGDFADRNNTHYREGVYVGYRYYDSVGKRPLYPFGYGLGYSEFVISEVSASIDGTAVTVETKVVNTGDFDGKEVVQVYVSSPEGKLDQPYQALAGFGKTGNLKPGACEQLAVTFDMKDLASYDEEAAAWILEKGDYVIRVGKSSADTVACAVVALDETAAVLQVRNAFGKPEEPDFVPERMPMDKALTVPLPRLLLSAASIETETAVYDVDPEIDPVVAEMSDEELCYMNMGAFKEGGGIESVIGEASIHVAGAAGETTSKLIEKEIPAIVMADGPAGIRISQNYFVDEAGAHTVGPNALLLGMADMLSGPAKFLIRKVMTGPKPKGEILHQYATAIPIGTAIAQSFNLAFAGICGDIVGDEMRRFGIQLWLAPALNIHRSILCGRNFEYYSEDPLVSGEFAAAITNGVQAYAGCGTTIKHFAANNQETCRYTNNSIVSERALREIYLKGFEICVKKSQPKALMTSYNLINGTHTSERRDLVTDILRSEWGYEGLVMTDWVISGMDDKTAEHRTPQPHLVAASGNDVYMPGSKKDYQNLLAALKDGRADRKQMQINATRVKQLAVALHEASHR